MRVIDSIGRRSGRTFGRGKRSSAPAAAVPPADLPRAMAFAVLLSLAFPGVWLVLGRLYLRDGRFFRRRRGRELVLVPANDVHLSRELRAAVGATRHGEAHGAGKRSSHGKRREVRGD